MPPKTKFSKEEIIEAAFEIGRVEGIDNITIRKVADKLGSSIAPIYVNFKDIEELKEAVVTKVFALSHRLLEEVSTGNPFRDIGVASLRFAKEYSVFFRDLVLQTNKYSKPHTPELDKILVSQMQKDPELAGLSEEQLMRILLKMRIFQTGLSVMVANGSLPEEFNGDNILLELLNSTSKDVILGARSELNEN